MTQPSPAAARFRLEASECHLPLFPERGIGLLYNYTICLSHCTNLRRPISARRRHSGADRAYVRVEWPVTGSRPRVALFVHSPDRKGEHPRAHLKDFRGVIPADGYTGFNELLAGGRASTPL